VLTRLKKLITRQLYCSDVKFTDILHHNPAFLLD